MNDLDKVRALNLARDKAEAARNKWLRTRTARGDDHPDTQKALAAFHRAKEKARALPSPADPHAQPVHVGEKGGQYVELPGGGRRYIK